MRRVGFPTRQKCPTMNLMTNVGRNSLLLLVTLVATPALARTGGRYDPWTSTDVAASAKAEAKGEKTSPARTASLWAHTVVCDGEPEPVSQAQSLCQPNDPGCSAVLEHAVTPTGRPARSVPSSNLATAADLAQQVLARLSDSCRAPGRSKGDQRGFRPDIAFSLASPDGLDASTLLDRKHPPVAASFGVTRYF